MVLWESIITAYFLWTLPPNNAHAAPAAEEDHV